MSDTTTPDDEMLFDLEEAMRDVVDPELGINVVDLGLVYDARVDEGEGGNVVTLDMTLTSAACPLTDVIEDQAHSALTGGPKPLHWRLSKRLILAPEGLRQVDKFHRTLLTGSI